MNYKHGLIAMKAWPFHKGHEFLIRTALEQCENVTVLLVHRSTQQPDGDYRASAIRLTFLDAYNLNVIPVTDLYTDDDSPESHVEWANYARSILKGDQIDVVFSSEAYGDGWAKALGVPHKLVDLRRTYLPISGTEIRNDPYLYWQYINENLRSWYLKKVLLVGPESTGKTTLCKNLSLKYGTVYAPEYGRIYDEQTREPNSEFDETTYNVFFANVINEQPKLAARAEDDARIVCFYDTDLLTTAIWYEEWQDANNPMYVDILNAHRTKDPSYDLILLSAPTVPSVDDGYRGQTEEVRQRFFTRLKEEYGWESHPIEKLVILEGTWEEREATAIKHINKLFEGSKVTLP